MSALSGVRPWLDGTGIALILLYLASFAGHNSSLQWDGHTYLYAARAAAQGLDPYVLANLAQVSNGHPVMLPFLYPLVALLPFLPLVALKTSAALSVWLGFKLALLAALVVLWKRLAPAIEWLPLALVAVFGFNGSALWDLRAGNVAILEATLVWAALAAFASGRRVLFAALVVAAACFKLTPAVLLVLLLVPAPGRRGQPALLAAALVLLVAAVWGPLVMGPTSHWRGFLTNVGEAIPLGDANPSLLALWLTLTRGGLAGADAARNAALAAWAVTAALILAASARWLVAAWRAEDARRWIFAAVYLWVLLAPRPMAYGFVALAPVPLFFAPPPFSGATGRLLLALTLCAQGMLRAASLETRGTLLFYTPALLALAVWLLIVQGRRPDAQSFPASALVNQGVARS